VSFVLLTYNQERYAAEAIRGALAQTYSPLQVVVSDDASTDGTFEVLRGAVAGYSGPHDLLVRRNPRNVGIADHINTVMGLAKGSILVVAAGDDVSLPNRVESCVKAMVARPELLSMCCGTRAIDAEGNVHPEWGDKSAYFWEEPVRERGERLTRYLEHGKPLILGCANAFRRELHDRFGPLHRDVVNEDNVYTFRAHLLGEVDRIDEVGVLYRRHPGTLSRKDNSGDSHWERARSRERARVLAQKRKAEVWRMMKADLELACRTGVVGWDARPQADEIRRRERVASLLARQPDRALPGRVADFLSLAFHRPSAGEFFGGMLRILPPSFVVGINGLRAWARTKAGIKG
jgi:glycosyltransferase involved in cell wall biosynthesis